MSVIGIDLGNENCYVAVARAGGIETIPNEYSQRSTPTYVAFGEKTRDLGVAAKNKQITNLKNTLSCFKRVIGRKYQDIKIQQELKYIPYETCEMPNGEVGFKVQYLGEQCVFTAQQVMAMMLVKLKEIAESNLGIKVQDCVISVPVYYTDVERRAMLDAAEIAGLNVLRLMNESTAVALAYGFYKQDLPEDKPEIVVFVDFGNSSLQVTACSFTNNKLQILGSAWNCCLGGRDFDNVLASYYFEDFSKRYKLDVKNNDRAVVRLLQECEKVKKQMSASSLDLPLNIECLLDDIDVTGRMKRETFEQLSSDLLVLLEHTLTMLFVKTKLRPEEIDSIQVVGGSSRLPSFKAVVQKVFGKEPKTTLNQDEAVARGCALQCAMLSPTCKNKDIAITDIQPYHLKMVYGVTSNEESELFPLFHPVPYSRLLTFYRAEPFTIDVYYRNEEIRNVDSKLGSFTIMNVKPTPEGKGSKVKVKARINMHGVFSLCSASMIEKPTGNSDQAAENSTDTQKSVSEDSMVLEEAEALNGNVIEKETDLNEMDKDDDDDVVEIKRVTVNKGRVAIKLIDLPIQSNVHGLDKHTLHELIEKEAEMIMQDKMEKERADARNAVEEYVYDLKAKLSSELERFTASEEMDYLQLTLEATEEWLYGEGETEQKSVYVLKLQDLMTYCDPVINRCFEWKQRPAVMNAFGLALQLIYKALQSYEAKEDLYAHIDKEEMLKVKNIWEQKNHWHGQYLQPLSKLLPHENPPVTVAAILKEKQELESIVSPILSTPKGKVEPKEKPKPKGKVEPKRKVEPEPEKLNGQPQTDSEMQDVSSSSEKVDKPEEASSNKTSQIRSEKMETN